MSVSLMKAPDWCEALDVSPLNLSFELMVNSIRVMVMSYLSYITWKVVNVQKKIQSSGNYL